jgi:hypothetical protein
MGQRCGLRWDRDAGFGSAQDDDGRPGQRWDELDAGGIGFQPTRRSLHGMMFVYGTPTVMIGLLKSASFHPTARRFARVQVIFT